MKKPEDFLAWAKEEWPKASSIARARISAKVKTLERHGRIDSKQATAFFEAMRTARKEMRKG